MSCIPEPSCPSNFCVKDCTCYPQSYCVAEKVNNIGQVVTVVVPIVIGAIFIVSLVICHLVARKRRKQREEMMRQRNVNSGTHVQVQPEQNFIPMYAPQTNYFHDYSTRIDGNVVPVENYSIGQPIDPINPYAPNVIHYGHGQPQPINGPNYFLKPGTTVGYVG